MPIDVGGMKKILATIMLTDRMSCRKDRRKMEDHRLEGKGGNAMDAYAMEASNLTMKYKKNSMKQALNHINLKLHKEQLIGLIGANGSGKTTFFKICNGNLNPTEGMVQILGGDAVENLSIREEVIYSMHALPVGENLTVGTVVGNYHMLYPHFDKEFAEKLLDLFGVSERAKIKHLSQGMVSVVHFICALSTRAKVTMLDEPFTGIDIEKRKLAQEVLLRDYMEYPRTILISSHNLAEMEQILSEMVLIHNGDLVFYEDMDTVREMLFRADGEAEQVKAFTGREDAVTCNQGELGAYFIGKGGPNGDFAREVARAGLKISAVAPEDVCVYLTSNRRESDLECLWK